MHDAVPMNRPAGGRRLVVLLVLLFALPFAVGGGLYALQWRPAAGAPHGELVSGLPALPLTGRWTLAVLANDCAQRCRERLELTRRIHVALGKQMPRVRRVLLVGAAERDATEATLRASWPDLVVASSDDAAWRAELAAVPPDETRLVVLDPEGRPVLRYPGPADAATGRGALRDLERLLKLSWIG